MFSGTLEKDSRCIFVLLRHQQATCLNEQKSQTQPPARDVFVDLVGGGEI